MKCLTWVLAEETKEGYSRTIDIEESDKFYVEYDRDSCGCCDDREQTNEITAKEIINAIMDINEYKRKLATNIVDKKLIDAETTINELKEKNTKLQQKKIRN